jgi:hypothetical protein
MNSSALALIIIGQITVFQFLSVAFVRSLFVAQLAHPPQAPSGAAAHHLYRARRHRFALGAILLVPALIGFFGLPTEPGLRKLFLAAVSLVSSVAFAGASLVDHRALRVLRDALPDGGVRRASLEPRSASHWYRRLWELLPVALVLLTFALTTVLGRRLGHIPTEMWVLQILQAAFVAGTLLYTARYGAAVPNVSSRLAMLRDRPEVALEFSERLAARQMQYFMAAKIGVALLLGVSTIEVALKALDHPRVALAEAVSWAVVGVLVLMFAGFLLQIITLTKSMQRQAENEASRVP